MSARILIVVPPLAGHVNPTVALGAELTERGHQVAWTGPAAGVADRLGPGRRLFDTNPELDRTTLAGMLDSAAGERGLLALKSLWERGLLPLADAMLPGVQHAVDDFEPDLMVVDQQALAGAVVACRAGLAWVTSATTSAELTDPLASLPRVNRQVSEALVDLQRRAGIPEAVASATELRRSPLLTVAYTTEALVGERLTWPSPVRFVGPALGDRPDAGDFPWGWLEGGRRHVLVSLGTVNASAGGRFFAVAAEALDRPDVQVICVGPPGVVPNPPANFLVRAEVPQLALLPHLDAVVCHAGHNTVCESLAHGVPLVLAPIRDDQSIVAEQVQRAGAGVRVRFGRVRSDGLAAAVDAVLDQPVYRERAAAIAASLREAGGVPAAADAIEELAGVPSGA